MIETVKQLLEYDPATGVFRWRPRPGNTSFNNQFSGKEAGSLDTHGYRQIYVTGKLILAHRLAWAFCHGTWPEGQIDHINGRRTDNRLCNLRDVGQSANQKNTKVRKDNTSGRPGVWFHKASGLWTGRVSTAHGTRSLGYFRSVGDATAARLRAEADNGYHQNHGRA